MTQKSSSTPQPIDETLASEEITREAGGEMPEAEVESKSEWQEKAEEYLTDLQRLQADFENYKKRQQAESKEFSSHLAKSIVTDLIPVLSNLQAAADHVPADLRESPWVMGITYIEKQFEDALRNYGVTAIEVKPGDSFNPTEHEAVDIENQESGIENQEKEQETITRVVQKGYKIGDRVIQPAKVIVSKA